MNTAQIHEVMQISRNFEKANKAAKTANNSLSELLSKADYFMTVEQHKILIQASRVCDEIYSKTNEWEADKFATNKQAKK